MKNYGLIKSYLLKLYNAYGKKADVVNAEGWKPLDVGSIPTLPTINGCVTQLVEYDTLNIGAMGSNPIAPTITFSDSSVVERSAVNREAFMES